MTLLFELELFHTFQPWHLKDFFFTLKNILG